MNAKRIKSKTFAKIILYKQSCAWCERARRENFQMNVKQDTRANVLSHFAASASLVAGILMLPAWGVDSVAAIGVAVALGCMAITAFPYYGWHRAPNPGK